MELVHTGDTTPSHDRKYPAWVTHPHKPAKLVGDAAEESFYVEAEGYTAAPPVDEATLFPPGPPPPVYKPKEYPMWVGNGRFIVNDEAEYRERVPEDFAHERHNPQPEPDRAETDHGG